MYDNMDEISLGKDIKACRTKVVLDEIVEENRSSISVSRTKLSGVVKNYRGMYELANKC